MIGYIKGQAGDAGTGKWDVAPCPAARAATGAARTWRIPRPSKHQKEAAELVTWLTAPEQQAKVFAKSRQLPVDNRRRIDRGRRRHRPVLQRRPDRPDLLRVGRRQRPCRSSARRTAS